MRFLNLFGFVNNIQKTAANKGQAVFFKTGKYKINLMINQFYFR